MSPARPDAVVECLQKTFGEPAVIRYRIEGLAFMPPHERIMNYSEKLKMLLDSRGVWHRFIEFDEPVMTVQEAGKKVEVAKIAKSIVMVDSAGDSLLAIVPAKSKVSHKKIKSLLAVRDVRLASHEEVLKNSGYPVGGVPPFNNIKRVLVDPQVLKSETAIVGGGDIDKLMEIKTKDIVNILNAEIADITQS